MDAVNIILKTLVVFGSLICLLLSLKKSVASVRFFWTISSIFFTAFALIKFVDGVGGGGLWVLLYGTMAWNAVVNVFEMKGEVIPQSIRKNVILVIAPIAMVTFIIAVMKYIQELGNGVRYMTYARMGVLDQFVPGAYPWYGYVIVAIVTAVITVLSVLEHRRNQARKVA